MANEANRVKVPKRILHNLLASLTAGDSDTIFTGAADSAPEKNKILAKNNVFIYGTPDHNSSYPATSIPPSKLCLLLK